MPRIGPLRHILGLALAALAALPAIAQQLDPQVGVPLQGLYNSAQMQCQQGNPQGCGAMQRLEQVAQQLSQAQSACQQGNPQACQFYQNSAMQVVGTWRQQQAQAGGFQGGGFQGGGFQGGGFQGGGQGYSTQQMTQDHNQRMQQQQQQFQQHQSQMQRQQQLNDDNHRRFMENLRR